MQFMQGGSAVFAMTCKSLCDSKSMIQNLKREKEYTAPPQAEQPVAPKVEPQVIYSEKPVKPSITPAQILGIVLLACSALCMILFACFGKRSYLDDVFALCLPVAL